MMSFLFWWWFVSTVLLADGNDITRGPYQTVWTVDACHHHHHHHHHRPWLVGAWQVGRLRTTIPA
jgi:hypothetical protein